MKAHQCLQNSSWSSCCVRIKYFSSSRRVNARNLNCSRRQIDPFEQPMQLFDAFARVPLASKAGKRRVNLVERHSIAATIVGIGPDHDLAAREDVPDQGRDLPHPIVLIVVADVEDLAVNRLARRLRGARDRLADVEHVHQRPPWRPVAGHA